MSDIIALPATEDQPLDHVIHWENRFNGRTGTGTKRFTRAEAMKLADDLNEEYPDIEHEAVPHD